MANPFESQVKGIRQANSGPSGYDSPESYKMDILKRYISGEGGLYNQVMDYAGAYRPDTAQSAINSLQAQGAKRQGLIQGIEDLPGQYEQTAGALKNDADQAMNSGVSNTRKNYNRRGLLFSGLREGGEQSVKSNVANSLASATAGATKDFQNTLDARKQALAQLELQSQAQSLQNANEAFELTTKNNIARAQALQQLGEGVGYAAGAYYGSSSSPQPPQNPNVVSRQHPYYSGDFNQ